MTWVDLIIISNFINQYDFSDEPAENTICVLSEFSAVGNSSFEVHQSSPANLRETRAVTPPRVFLTRKTRVVIIYRVLRMRKTRGNLSHRVSRSGELEIYRKTRCGKLGIYPSRKLWCQILMVSLSYITVWSLGKLKRKLKKIKPLALLLLNK